MEIGKFNDYLGYEGTIEYRVDTDDYCGAVIIGGKVIVYTGKTVMQLRKNFRDAVMVYTAKEDENAENV